MRDRTKEKERLWKEVLDQKRAYEKEDLNSDIQLTMNPEAPKDTGSSFLRDADHALQQLNEILQKQKESLASLTTDTKKVVEEPLVEKEAIPSVEQLEKELKKDYGETPQKEEKDFDSAKVFQEIITEMNQEIIGQEEAVRSTATAFRRPYVMGMETDRPANVILITGPHGSGRHAAISTIAHKLEQRHIFSSSEVDTIDMSRYTSGSQEQIFLQDMYEALNGKGKVICFENFENTFAGFNRMVSELATTGEIILSKRYVLSQGILVENQTGLVKNAVDRFSINGKYLIFLTSNPVSSVQDAFGADFMYHILDQITFHSLKEEGISQLIVLQSERLTKRCQEQLHLTIHIPEEIRSWIHMHFDKTRGADSIMAIFKEFYISLSQFVLEENIQDTTVTLQIEEGMPYAYAGNKKISLSREKNQAEEIAEVNREIDKIVGLEEVKEYVHSLQSHLAIQQKRREQGMKASPLTMHMIFTGNPGTGKTTIARLLGRYMKAIGALSKGQLVEVTRADLVAQYVGQTAPLTMSVIKSAMGGILFIDEAYSLYRGKEDSFGLEAIDTLVKAMEDHRDDLIVILAGYKKEMAVFLEANSGLRSRFPNKIDFKDYTGEQLYEIACIQATSKGYHIAEDAKESLVHYFTRVQAENASEAGNGRLARNTIEEAILAQSQRLLQEEDANLSLLKREDFQLEKQ